MLLQASVLCLTTIIDVMHNNKGGYFMLQKLVVALVYPSDT